MNKFFLKDSLIYFNTQAHDYIISHIRAVVKHGKKGTVKRYAKVCCSCLQKRPCKC